MATFVKGDVIVVPFPFSDLSGEKKRPAMVITELDGDDIILCQITSQQISDRYSIQLGDQDFDEGTLKKSSNLRPNRIFTADKQIILYKVGRLKKQKIDQIIQKIIEIIKT